MLAALRLTCQPTGIRYVILIGKTAAISRHLVAGTHNVVDWKKLKQCSQMLGNKHNNLPRMDESFDVTSEAQNLVQSLRIRILGLSRARKQVTMFAADMVGYGGCVFVSIWLLFGGQIAPWKLVVLLGATLLVAVPLTWVLGLYRSIVRYMGVDLFVAGTKTATVSAVVLGLISWMANLVPAPTRWAVVFGAISLIYVVSGRMIARMFLNRRNMNREQVIIYGAGEGGARLAAALFSGDDYLPVALIDDNLTLHGKRVHGLEVFPPSRLEGLIDTTEATGVLLAVPSASRHRRRQILERLSKYSVHVRTIPEVKDLVSGKARVDDLSDVDVKDLLGRDPVPPNEALLCASVTNKNVMVTGAGGSIGSELCRQILKLKPKRLVCFEISEASLYSIDRELKKLLVETGIKCELVALLGSAHHEKRIREALQVFGIHTVYHAAAYKHLPIVERNLFEGIHNNVFGTLHSARAAIDAGVETFVLVSTDKAVNPTSVMGATKRLSEQVLQAYNSRVSKTRFCMVRFGNVLESSGSVVPLFREQIRAGGPVTVTHRDIIRYFMTIPESAQLVIQAASMAEGGDVFVLDMGKPVRIEDLARRMINLMGLTICDHDRPDGDIEIQYIGLRPAEKLYEELLIGSNVSGTEHPRIMRADEEYLSFEELDEIMGELKLASSNLDYDQARRILLRAVAEYKPSNGIDDLVWLQRTGTGTDAKSGDNTIVDFPKKEG